MWFSESRDEWKTGGLPQKLLNHWIRLLHVIHRKFTKHIVTTTVPTLVGAGGLYAVALLGVVVVVRRCEPQRLEVFGWGINRDG